jgi:hypothetical protein
MKRAIVTTAAHKTMVVDLRIDFDRDPSAARAAHLAL